MCPVSGKRGDIRENGGRNGQRIRQVQGDECGFMTDAGFTCASCHERFASAQSVKGECRVCGAVICYRCWAVGKRTCADHSIVECARTANNEAIDAGPVETGRKSTGILCLRCGQEIPRAAVRCAAKPYCAACQSALSSPPDPLPEGAVPVSLAQYGETLFHRFAEDALSRTAWPGAEPLPVRRVRKRPRADVGALPDDFAATHPYGDALLTRQSEMPRNRAAALEVVYRSSRLPGLGKKKRVTFVLISYADLRTLIEQGCVAARAGARELNVIVNQAGALPENGVVIAFSPAGWAETLTIPDKTVLAAPGANGRWTVRHALAEPDMKTFVERLFEVESDAEKIERCMEEILGETSARFPLSARSVARVRGVPLCVAAEAFRRIADGHRRYLVCDDPGKKDWLLDIR